LTDRNPQAWQDHSTPNRAAFESVMMTWEDWEIITSLIVTRWKLRIRVLFKQQFLIDVLKLHVPFEASVLIVLNPVQVNLLKFVSFWLKVHISINV
jgi:hypothetical protein